MTMVNGETDNYLNGTIGESTNGVVNSSNINENQLEPPPTLFPKTPNDSAVSLTKPLSKVPSVGDSLKGASSDVDGNVNSKKPRKKKPWYSAFNITYKRRSDDFHKLFKTVPDDEKLISDYSCAFQKDILIHGRMYISPNYICFHANIIRWEAANICLSYKEIISITKEKTAKLIPNAIEMRLKNGERYFFASFAARDKSFLMIFRVWQNSLLDQMMTESDVLNLVKQTYGDDLGLSSSEDDNISFNTADSVSERQYDISLPKNGQNAREDSKSAEDSIDRGEKSVESNSSQSNSSEHADVKRTNSTHSMNGEDAETDNREEFDEPYQGLFLSGDAETSLCGCNDHPRLTLLNRTYHMDIDYMFECLFSNNDFARNYRENRKLNVTATSDWKPVEDDPNLEQRTLEYSVTSSLKALGSRVVSTVEKQVCRKTENLIIVNSEIQNSNIPYSDKFHITTRYCISKVDNKNTSLRIGCDILYSKNIWAMSKSLIERNTIQALQDTYQELDQRLQAECAQNTMMKPSYQTPKASYNYSNATMNSHIHKFGTSNADNKGEHIIYRIGSFSVSISTMLKICVLAIIILIFMNTMLYFKLKNIEHLSSQMLREGFRFFPESYDTKGWESLFLRQQVLHDVEIRQWKGLVTGSLSVMEKINKLLSESVHLLSLNAFNHTIPSGFEYNGEK